MGLFGKSKKQLEKENQALRQMVMSQSSAPKTTSAPKVKKVMYQCRYCGYKSIRNASDGAPLPGAHCNKHPKGWCKGPHSWMRTTL